MTAAATTTDINNTSNFSTAKLFNSNFHPLEVVDRVLQVSENYSDLIKWSYRVNGLISSVLGQVGTYTWWALIPGGHLYLVGTYTWWALIPGGHLYPVGTYTWWALIPGGHLYLVGTYTWWALIPGGHLYLVGTYTWWALIPGGHSYLVGTYTWWALIPGGQSSVSITCRLPSKHKIFFMPLFKSRTKKL